ncbi:MAG: hypothetical protein WC876_01945 [Candidatus Thermoplasmatota archaeon]|jgi:hypothetical protein
MTMATDSTTYGWAAVTESGLTTSTTRIPGLDGPRHTSPLAARRSRWPSPAAQYVLVAWDPGQGERGLTLRERLQAGLEEPLSDTEAALCPKE